MFMIYDGSVFRITPTDDAALALVRRYAKNSVRLSAETLHANWRMGILLGEASMASIFQNLH